MILSCIIQVDTSMVIILYYKGDNSNINLQKLFNDVLILHLYAMYTEYKTQFKEYSNEISCWYTRNKYKKKCIIVLSMVWGGGL